MVRFNKKVLYNFAIYALGSILLKGSSFVIIPLLMRKISPSDIGLLSLLNNSIALISVVIALGLRQVVSIEFFHKNSTEQKKLLADICLIYTSIAPPLLASIYCARPWLNQAFFSNQLTQTILCICLLHCFLAFFAELIYQVLMYRCQALFLTITQVIATCCTFLASLYVVYYTNSGVLGILCANAFGIIIVCSIGLYAFFAHSLNKHCSLQRVKKNIRSYIILGLPFIPSVLAGWALISVNRWLIAARCSLHEVGIYSIIDMGHNLFRIFILYPISGAYLPLLLKQFAKHKQSKDALKRIDAKNKKLMVFAMLTVFVLTIIGYILGKPYACIILPPVYHQALPWLLLLATANIFLMGTYFTTCYLQFLKKSVTLAGSLFITALIALSLSYALIPQFGIPGGLAALLIAYVIYFIALACINNYFHKKESRYTN